MMMIYLSVKFEFDWTKHLWVKSLETEMLMDRQELTQIWIRLDKAFSS